MARGNRSRIQMETLTSVVQYAVRSGSRLRGLSGRNRGDSSRDRP
jgi:hypothetical protein